MILERIGEIITVLSSISIELGKGVLKHNNRKFIAGNVDKDRTKNNIEYKNISLEEAYHILFDDALQRYNDKQSRPGRRIKNYLEHIQNGNQEKPFYEIIVQVGNRDDMGIGTCNEELAKGILDEYMKHFQERNPRLFVFNAHLHMDEATPHLHIDFIPFTTESKHGLDTRTTMKQALADQGVRGSGKSDTETMAWIRLEKEALSKVMERHCVEWEHQGNDKDHLSVLEYKKEQRSKEVEELEAQVSTLKGKIENLTTAIETVTVLSTDDEFEEEYKLPEPQRLESAKSYKERVEEKFEKLKAFVKRVFVELMRTRSENKALRAANQNLAFENSELRDTNRNYQKTNRKLHKQLTDYRLLRKVLGSKNVDRLLDEAKGKNKNEKEEIHYE